MVSYSLRAAQRAPAGRGAVPPEEHRSRRPGAHITAGTSALVTRVSNATEFSQSLLVTLKFLLHSDCKRH